MERWGVGGQQKSVSGERKERREEKSLNVRESVCGGRGNPEQDISCLGQPVPTN